MGEQILRAKSGEQVFELGAQDVNGNYGLRTFDEPVRQAVLAVLAQLDDASTDTVLSVLKLILAELGQKLEPGGNVNVSNFPSTQTVNDGGLSLTVDGTVGVSNADFPLPQTQLDALKPPTSQTVSGTVSVSNHPTDVAKEATLNTAVTQLTSILGQLDDATADTVLSVLKALLAELSTKLEDGGTVNVGNFPATQTVAGTVSVNNHPAEIAVNNQPTDVLNDIKRDITDYEERFEFDANGNPLYVGKAPIAALTSDAVWTVYKFTFSGGLPQRKQVRAAIAWDNRGTSF